MSMMVSCQDDTNSTNDKESALSAHMEDYEAPHTKWGLINNRGKKITGQIFDDIHPFQEGFAPVSQDGLWGFIDLKGKRTIPCQYLSAFPFHDQLAVVQGASGQYAMIDTVGEFRIKPEYDMIQHTGGDLALVTLEGKFFYYNIQSDKITLGPFNEATPFNNGIAVVKTGNLSYLIDHEGEALSDTYNAIVLTDQGFIPFRNKQSWGFLDRNGKVAIDADYSSVRPFIDGRATVMKNGEHLLIDTSGKRLTATMNYMINLGNDWLGIQDGSQWKITKIDGDTLDLRVDEIHRFQDKRAVYRKNMRWNFLDNKGTPRLPTSQYLIWDFEKGYARYIGESGTGVLDTNGKVILDPTFANLRDLNCPDRWAYQ